MPRRSLWPERLPDAITQLTELDHDLVTRRDLETILGLSRARAAELMKSFGAERVGSVLALKRPKLLRQFRAMHEPASSSRGPSGGTPARTSNKRPPENTERARRNPSSTTKIDRRPTAAEELAALPVSMPRTQQDQDSPVFARHETFAVRSGWLKKGFDAACADSQIFLADDAPLRLGVGKNMVKAIRYWCHAFKLLEERREAGGRSRPTGPTELGTSLLGPGGWDPFLEDLGSLWYLHWKLVQRPCLATAWHFAFTAFTEREFTVDQLSATLSASVARTYLGIDIAPASIHKDVLCIIRMYSDSPDLQGVTEDTIASPFAALGLIRADGARSYEFSVGDKPDLPPKVAVAAFLEFAAAVAPGARTIGVGRLLYDHGSPGMAFKLTESALVALIESVAVETGRVSLADTAGLVQMSFFDEPSTVARELLAMHYSASRPQDAGTRIQ